MRAIYCRTNTSLAKFKSGREDATGVLEKSGDRGEEVDREKFCGGWWVKRDVKRDNVDEI